MSEASEGLLDIEPRPDPYVGKVLAGRYKILRVLGAGGMGAVYEAEHTLIGRRVAVKLLYSQLAGDAQVVKRFVNEARAAATIGHPHILECTDIGQADDGSPFLVLELLEGHDLDKDFEILGPMPIGRLVTLLRQACSALVAAHEKGIVHRDIKPENIYLSVQKGVPDHVKVLDFGISKFNSLNSTGPGTMSGSAMGTPYYMSPEQFRDASNVDARADIYAMGIILYQGFAGRLPFASDNLPSLALEIATGTPIPLEQIRPDLPPELVALVKKAMSRSADDRYQSMRELDAALEPFAKLDAPVQVREVDAQSIAHMQTAASLAGTDKHSKIRLKTDDNRRPTGAIIALGALLALGGGGAAVYAVTRPKPAPPIPFRIVHPQPAAATTPTETAAAPTPAVKHRVSISSNAEGATAIVRGRTVPLPFVEELEATTTPEIIDVTAPDKISLRFALAIDRPRTLYATLERGSGQRVATESEIALALTGLPNTTNDSTSTTPTTATSTSSSSSRTRSSSSTTSTSTSSPSASPSPMMQERNVYTGPSGDLPEL